MNVQDQIDAYFAAQPELKRRDLQELHGIILGMMPNCRLWFLDGKDEAGRTISNPNIGYGVQTMTYADGQSREFYQIGISANTTGISTYIMGIKDKKYLSGKYGKTIGQASVTGYCIQLKAHKNLGIDVRVDEIRYGIDQTHAGPRKI